MGQKLVLNIVRNDEKIFNIYLDNGANTSTKINVICNILGTCNKDDNLEMLLRKTTKVLPGCGLTMPIAEEDRKVVLDLIKKGIPEGSPEKGFIGVTPDVIKGLMMYADDVLNIYLDKVNRLAQTLYYSTQPFDGAKVLPLPELFETVVTQENAFDLLREFTNLDCGCFSFGDGVLCVC